MDSKEEAHVIQREIDPAAGRRFLKLFAIVGAIIFLFWLLQPSMGHPPWVWRLSTQKNVLKLTGIAIHDVYDEFAHLPQSQYENSKGQVVHGWMTQLLPYLEGAPDRNAIEWEARWNDERNRSVFTTDVEAFQSVQPDIVRKDLDGYSLAHIAGNQYVIREDKPISFRDITDGTSNTLLLGEVYGSFQPWGKPGNVRDPILGINTSPYSFGTSLKRPAGFFGATERLDRCWMVFGDGAVHNFSSDVDPDVLRRLALPNDGERVEDF